MKRALLLALGLLAGCGEFPRDASGTSRAIAERGHIRVGITADTGVLPQESARGRALLARLGAPAIVERGPTEPLLVQLEEGELDLVLTPLTRDSAWATRVSLGPSIADADIAGSRHELRPAVRNGENALIGRVYRAAMAIGGRE